MSVKELADNCDASQPTIYRRVSELQEYDLLTEETHIEQHGNHYTVYQSNVSNVHIDIDPDHDDIRVDIQYRKREKQFMRLWEGLTE